VLLRGLNGDEQPGAWGSLSFLSGSTSGQNQIHFGDFRGGGSGDALAMLVVDDAASLQLVDSVLQASASHGLAVGDTLEFSAQDNLITQNQAQGVRVHPNTLGSIGKGTFGPNARPGVLIPPGIVTRNTTWEDPGEPLFVVDNLSILGQSAPARLTLSSGVELVLSADAVVNVTRLGALSLSGTPQDPVIVRATSSIPGQSEWGQIVIYASSDDSVSQFQHAEIRSGGSYGQGQIYLEPDASLQLNHVQFDSAQCDIYGQLDQVLARSTTFTPCPP
jgi:hypothetical protein